MLGQHLARYWVVGRAVDGAAQNAGQLGLVCAMGGTQLQQQLVGLVLAGCCLMAASSRARASSGRFSALSMTAKTPTAGK
jgi:hypothetical protein